MVKPCGKTIWFFSTGYTCGVFCIELPREGACIIARATGCASTSTTEPNCPVPDVNQLGATGLIHVGLHRADPRRYFFTCSCSPSALVIASRY